MQCLRVFGCYHDIDVGLQCKSYFFHITAETSQSKRVVL